MGQRDQYEELTAVVQKTAANLEGKPLRKKAKWQILPPLLKCPQ